jgi:protein-tyrosine phosphatase
MSRLAASNDAHAEGRLLPLERGRNFRDLGGYITEDGRRVRRGVLFRSGVLAYLTEQDYAVLQKYGIRALCDLRSAAEREREPTRWRSGQVTTAAWDYDLTVATKIGRAARDQSLTRQHMTDLIIEFYSGLPSRLTVQMRDIFGLILAGTMPLVIHCAAGKDRTGVVVAILLSALKVPRDTIVADYSLSAKVTDYEEELRAHPPGEHGMEANLGISDHPGALLRLLPEIRHTLFASNPEYLLAAFSELERTHGSVTGFIHSELGFSSGDIAKLEQLVLE